MLAATLSQLHESSLQLPGLIRTCALIKNSYTGVVSGCVLECAVPRVHSLHGLQAGGGLLCGDAAASFGAA